MLFGSLLIVIAIACYVGSAFLAKHYLDKNVRGLLEADMLLGVPPKGKEYFWEKTAGTGIVPKWVSIIGLLAIPLIIVRLILFVLSLF